jgi:hypothetical protein
LQTAVKTDAPGTDINNLAFDQLFRIPVTTADITDESLQIACMDKEAEISYVDVLFKNLQKAPDMTLQDNFDIGGGVKVRLVSR